MIDLRAVIGVPGPGRRCFVSVPHPITGRRGPYVEITDPEILRPSALCRLRCAVASGVHLCAGCLSRLARWVDWWPFGPNAIVFYDEQAPVEHEFLVDFTAPNAAEHWTVFGGSREGSPT